MSFLGLVLGVCLFETPGSELAQGRLALCFPVQGNFRHASSGAPVAREELMTLLSRLEDLRLRGLYFTETQRLTLSGVGLEEASDTGSGRRAHHVETCACPPDYAGDSCQVGNSPTPQTSPRGLLPAVRHPAWSATLYPSLKFLLGCSFPLPGMPSGIKYEKKSQRLRIQRKAQEANRSGGCKIEDFPRS